MLDRAANTSLGQGSIYWGVESPLVLGLLATPPLVPKSGSDFDLALGI